MVKGDLSMKKKYLIEFKNDLWVVVMDIIAVNAAYILSLLLRYYVHSEFKSAAMRFVNVYLKFAPFYTVICIIVFALFHLYNGVWRFASLNDMNRIISATAVTAILNFVCTTVFLQRLPISYYVVGTTLQFIFITLIRFSYRFLVFKGNVIRESINPGIPVIVIGGTIPSNKMIAYFESNTSFKPVAIVDYKLRGKSLNGLPVMESLEEALETFKVKNIIVMDPMMSDREKDRLRKISQQKNSELHDYTSVMMKGFANISLLDIAKIMKEPYKVRFGEELYDNLDEAMENLEGKYTVKTITGKDIVIDINQVVRGDSEE
jgi:FlaA1/EpsC-like NDP-sugar epimerase